MISSPAEMSVDGPLRKIPDTVKGSISGGFVTFIHTIVELFSFKL